MTAPNKVEMSETESLKAEVAKLKAEKDQLVQTAAARKDKKFDLKVSKGGSITIGGLSTTWGYTGFSEDVLTILENKAEIAAFILANKARLSFGRDKDLDDVKEIRRNRSMERAKALLK